MSKLPTPIIFLLAAIGIACGSLAAKADPAGWLTTDKAMKAEAEKPLWLITYHQNEPTSGYTGRPTLRRTTITEHRPDVWLEEYPKEVKSYRRSTVHEFVIDFAMRLQ